MRRKITAAALDFLYGRVTYMKKILLIGGDIRIRTVYSEFKKKGFLPETLGLFDDDDGKIEEADIIILPIPASRDGKRICCPLTNRFIPLSDIEKSKPDALILGGCISFSSRHSIDYGSLDSYALLNAVPTAEGAIATAIETTPFTLWKSNVLVIGAGRTGKILSERLAAMKCCVTVSARKNADFALLDAMNIKHIHTADIAKQAENFDIIFNTVDAPVLENITFVKKNALLIDLSSRGCISPEKISELGIKFLKLPGIPGKTAPETAGRLLAEVLTELLKQITE